MGVLRRMKALVLVLLVLACREKPTEPPATDATVRVVCEARDCQMVEVVYPDRIEYRKLCPPNTED
jgi:hypothetical protein